MNNYLRNRPTVFPRILLLVILFCTTYSLGYAQDTNSETSQTTQSTKTTKASDAEQVTSTSQPAPTSSAITEQAGTNNQTTTPDPSGAADLSVSTGEDQPLTKDPLEKFNRAMFTFNDKLDIYLLKPIATFYNTIMPRPLNQGVHNFFLNIGNLPTIANDILQFNFYQMANDMWRLGINTTIGIGGLFDIAGRMGLEPYTNDFGLTLAAWGYENSTYLVLPFFGPNTIRDGIGIPVDYYVFSIYPHIKPYRTRYAIYGLGVIDRRAQLLQFQSVLEEASIDKYVFVRNAYLQRRAYQIEQNQHLSFADKGWPSANQEYVASTNTSETEITKTSDSISASDESNQPVKTESSPSTETSTTKTDEKQ